MRYTRFGMAISGHTREPELRLFCCEALHVLSSQNFIGKDALVKQREEGLTQLLGMFTIDMQSDTTTLPWGKESIYQDGEFCGYVTSAGFGHTLGKAVCMGYVSSVRRRDIDASGGRTATTLVGDCCPKDGQYEIEIDGKLWSATLHLTPPLN